MRYNFNESMLLKEIYKSPKGIYIYNFHKKYSIYPSELIKFVKKYEKLGFISLEGNKVNITKKGKQEIIKYSGFTDRRDRKNIFKNIPKDFVQPKLKINEFYLADIEFLQ